MARGDHAVFRLPERHHDRAVFGELAALCLIARESASGEAQCAAPQKAVIPAKAGIKYAAVYRSITSALEYWITRFRG
jgi:hypothetical protein